MAFTYFQNIQKKRYLSIAIFSVFIFAFDNLAVANNYTSQTDTPKAQQLKFGPNNITTLVLEGNHQQMGVEYGQAMQSQLLLSLKILEDFYIIQHGITYAQMVAQGEAFYQRYPFTYQLLIQGIAQGANMSLSEVQILNAMETMGELLPNDRGSCAFISLPPQKSSSGTTLIGRNYDFPPPFDQIAQNLTVTVLKEDNAIPTAIIGLPGQIYCPSCVNKNNLFMELNNGMPSGGSYIDKDRQSLLINMLQIMQNSATLAQMEKQLNATQSDYSLIVNTADATQTKSYEFSSTLGMKEMLPGITDPFVSTNFYLSTAWQNIPVPTNATTWMGVTRRNNLLNLAQPQSQFDINLFQALMDKNIAQGGGARALTIYQIIYDPSTQNLYLKINKHPSWNLIPLSRLFA